MLPTGPTMALMLTSYQRQIAPRYRKRVGVFFHGKVVAHLHHQCIAPFEYDDSPFWLGVVSLSTVFPLPPTDTLSIVTQSRVI